MVMHTLGMQEEGLQEGIDRSLLLVVGMAKLIEGASRTQELALKVEFEAFEEAMEVLPRRMALKVLVPFGCVDGLSQDVTVGEDLERLPLQGFLQPSERPLPHLALGAFLGEAAQSLLHRLGRHLA